MASVFYRTPRNCRPVFIVAATLCALLQTTSQFAFAQSVSGQTSDAGTAPPQDPQLPNYGVGPDQTPTLPTATTAPDPAEAADGLASGSTGAATSAFNTPLRLNERIRSDSLTTGSQLDEDLRRVNMPERGVDDLAVRQDPTRADAQGIRLGSFVLKPSVNQSIDFESQKTGSTTQNRTFSQTELRSTLTSDWDRHALTITGDGVLQRNLSGEGEEKPTANIDADLRLDLADSTTAHLTAGYNFYREDTDDPNAIAGATEQSAVNTFLLGASIEREVGLLRGTTAVALTRSVYTDARLSDGSIVPMGDRDQTAGTWRGRIGYELSPALVPFIEVTLAKAVYDEKRDSAGYERSNHGYGAKAGVQIDLGDKLKGEIGLGYERTVFEDNRLGSIDAPTVDGSLAWSPHRGTDVGLTFATSVQPSTTPGESGYVAYQLGALVTHQLRDDLTAKFSGGPTWRRYSSGSSSDDQTVYDAALGLTWNMNRYLDLTSTLGYELTTSRSSSDNRQLQAGVGLTLKR